MFHRGRLSGNRSVCEGRHSISADEGELKDVLSTCKTLTTIEAGNWTNELTRQEIL